MKNYFLVMAMVLFLCIGCKDESKKIREVSDSETTENVQVVGNYVSEDYSKRNEGYDWVAVLVTEKENDHLHIAIRSRADKKKPTCTFDAIAQKVNDTTYQTVMDGKPVVFEFTNSKIRITTKTEEDEGFLQFYCSGGASIAGSYQELNEAIDQSQMDKTKFNKVLQLQDVGFNVSSIKQDGKNTLTIFTFGLEECEYNETFNIDGEEVINAEVEDLNADGSPELFVYTQSVGSCSYGKVYAFSVNDKKSMSKVYFQPTAENTKINKGYMGHDEFSLVENTLVQRFPIYTAGDINTEPTGKTRQISYKLVEGEAVRKLEVDNIAEY